MRKRIGVDDYERRRRQWLARQAQELAELPGCATCGERPIGTYQDGSPRFAIGHVHPIVERKA